MPETPRDLRAKITDPGFTPSVRDLDALFSLASDPDDDVADDVERALFRLEAVAAKGALERFEASKPPLRHRLCALVGRIARSTGDEALVEWLSLRTRDSDAKTRRRAYFALGKFPSPAVESTLLEAWNAEAGLPEKRAVASALGNVGGPRALSALAGASEDPELSRIASEARLKIERTVLRSEAASIDGAIASPRPTELLLHVRAGLERFLLSELEPELSPRILAPGRVGIRLVGPLARVFRARTFLHFGFPLDPEPVEDAPGDSDAIAASVVRALTAPRAWEIFRTWTRGPIRYRIEWADAGHRRSMTWRIAEAVAQARSELINDAASALWEAVVSERSTPSGVGRAVSRSGRRGRRLMIELWPVGLEDPRFAYRKRTLPASSHPTIAAALAQAAETAPNEVVWDPFVGVGTELVERARLGPCAELWGSDTDPEALTHARENLKAANLRNVELTLGDARSWRPPNPVSLVITNPPFGKRIQPDTEMPAFVEAFLANVKKALRPGGRLVWMSPLPEASVEIAKSLGLRTARRQEVDMGGTDAELQVMRG